MQIKNNQSLLAPLTPVRSTLFPDRQILAIIQFIMDSNFKIQQHEDGGCTSDGTTWRVATPLFLMSNVFNLKQTAYIDIPFPLELNSPKCFSHPIWKVLTEEQHERIITFNGSFDLSFLDMEHSEFAQTHHAELKDPRFCSFYIETALDPFENVAGDSFDLERSFGSGYPYRFMRFNTFQLTNMIKLFLSSNEQGSLICYEAQMRTPQYAVISFVYDAANSYPENYIVLTNTILDTINAGKSPFALDQLIEMPEIDQAKVFALAMIGDETECVSWDAGLYLIGALSESREERWLAKLLYRRMFDCRDEIIRYANMKNVEWFLSEVRPWLDC